MTMPHTSIAPPRWPQAALRAVLPDDPMRDAIVGDLHEEFVHDAARVGPARARVWYQRRAAGIVAHALFDTLRWRSWASTTPPAERPRPVAAPAVAARPRAGGFSAGFGAVALGVLLVGIVANTLLFGAARQGPHPSAPAGSALGSAIGVAAVVLAVVCAGVAALVLCAGPRWLRRRVHGEQPPCEAPHIVRNTAEDVRPLM
jgi:hypothetical protein